MKPTLMFLVILTISLTINCFIATEASESGKVLADNPSPEELKRNHIFYYEITPLIKEIDSGLSQINDLLRTRPMIGPNVSENQLNKFIEISRRANELISEKNLWLKANNTDRLNTSIGRTQFAIKQSQISNKKDFITRQINKAISYINSISKNNRSKKFEQNIISDAERTNQTEEQIEKERFDDFWKGKVNPKLSVKEEDDEFWSSVNQSPINKNLPKYSDIENDFLSEASKDSEKNFWSGGGNSRKKAKVTYKIESGQNDTWGVISSEGKVLIPYKQWNIKSYRDGLARVQVRTGEGYNNSCRLFKSTSSPGYSYWVSIVDEGIVDISGNWVLSPEKKILGGYGKAKILGLYLTLVNDNETEESIRRTKARNQKKLRTCRIKMKEEFGQLVERYLSYGYKRGN